MIEIKKFNIGMSFLAASGSVITIFTQNAIAQSPIDLKDKIISTRADDLDVSIPTYQLVQRQLDLEQFCQNYPFNSQCTKTNPSTSPPPATNREIIPEQSRTGWAIVPEISTLGLGANVVRKITPQVNARVGINAFNAGLDNIVDTDVDYEADLNLFNVSTLIDFHPLQNSGFKVTGGLIFNDNNVEATADISREVAEEVGVITFQGQTIDLRNFDLSGIAIADAEADITNSVSPYLGIGGGNAVADSKKLGFWWNLGVVFGGTPDVEMTANLSEQIPQQFREEAEAAAAEVIEDEEKNIEDELISVYPVISLGLSYQF